ncbi:DUF3732 domain-containing protein [Clostridium sporogenes]|uniref:DUF3732 domain-containing protein n=1 Tax=Clostridium sporogenes TaxID=1509 RepID=UPI0013D863B9|nr:DUF3732 domain-containing protein [Clostridium sporogenes]NFQ68083.1 DUF3732 domain-containing protein [Clostridium sporogenes]
MSRWKIKNIILYSHENDRKIVELNTSGMTIITGKSSTGKSAISEIIDYSMCSSECHLPGIIREFTSWVGITLFKEQEHLVIIRRVPELNKNKSSDIYIHCSNKGVIPRSKDDIIPTFRNIDKAKFKLEQIFGIKEYDTNFDENPYKYSQRISIRGVVPYLIQDDDTIISKNNLLRGMNTQRRNYIIDSVPYFLGIVDAEYITNLEKLKRLRKDFLNEKRNIQYLESISKEDDYLVSKLFNEAVEVGLINNDMVKNISRLTALNNIDLYDSDIDENDINKQLDQHYHEYDKISYEISSINNDISDAEKYLSDTLDYNDNMNVMKNRLRSVDLFQGLETKEECPLCHSKNTHSNIMKNIVKQLESLRLQLSEVEAEKLRIEEYISNKREQLGQLKTRRKDLKKIISQLASENESIKKRIGLQNMQNRVIGKIEFFKSTYKEKDKIDYKKIENLEEELSKLEAKVDKSVLLEKKEDARLIINRYASDFIEKLPLEKNYKGCPLDLNINDMNVSVITNDRRVKMRDVGSDMNYLSLHVSFILAIQKFLSLKDSSIPSFVVFDQLSRPFFPPDYEKKENLDEIIFTAEDEKAELKKYFEAIFEYIDMNEDIQIIVLEHAYFSDFERFRKAVKHRWNSDDALIPNSWIK